MRKHLYVDNVDLATYGVYISGQGTFGAPEREYTFYDVPGRDGSIPGINTRLRNIEVKYDCFIYSNFETNIRNLRSFLLSKTGYVRIEDDYDTTHFRRGIYSGPFEPYVKETNDAGSFTLTFNCQPQRWLKSGEQYFTLTGLNPTITNPTIFKAKPLVRVQAASSTVPDISFGGVKIVIDDTVKTSLGLTYVDIDCETQNVYNGTTNLAAYVAFKDSGSSVYGLDAPTLAPGVNTIYQSNGVTIYITPRWWEL